MEKHRKFKTDILYDTETLFLPNTAESHFNQFDQAINPNQFQYDNTFNRFWFRPVEEDGFYSEIQSELNSLNRDLEPFANYFDVQVDQVVAAPYDGNYYRAKILSVIHGTENVFYNVILMDLGLEGEVEFNQIRRLRGVSAKYIDIPPRVFECRLTSLQPSEMHSERYGWGPTMAEFKHLTQKTTVSAEIYSVDNGVASVFVFVHDRTVQDILIDSGFARVADEGFMSKMDHDMRMKAQAGNSSRFEDECDLIEEEIRKMMPLEEEYEVPEPDISLRHNVVNLKGPKSPLESTIYSCLHMSKVDSKKVSIEPHSVNSVLLEANSQDAFEKFVVAANVTENQNHSELTARETTIMPNIPGFGPLMALIFSPYCELFRDKYKSRYVSVLCGLGEHPTDEMPMYCEHDTFFNFDTEIDVEDIENINTIRFIMDSLLQMKPDQKRPNNTEYQQTKLMLQLKTKVIELLEKERPLMGITYNDEVGWSKYDPNDLIKAKDIFGHFAIFPSHNILSLSAEDSPERLDQIHTLIENNKMLHQTSKNDVTLRRPVKCLLCHSDLESVSLLRIHLYSRRHLEREKKIQFEK